jgi:hypothetical protein
MDAQENYDQGSIVSEIVSDQIYNNYFDDTQLRAGRIMRLSRDAEGQNCK